MVTRPRPFRFGVQIRCTDPRETWLEEVRRAEVSGFSTLLALDHFVRGLDPFAELAAAAMVTTSLRVGSLVFANDYRHPAVLAKAVATIDVLSGGRMEFGIGAGWLRDEYEQAGVPFDPAPRRLARMVEAIHLINRLFTEDEVTFAGEHYLVDRLTVPPKPVQQPHPPLLIGGGSRRVLSIAAREADIVGFTTRADKNGRKDPTDMTAATTTRKLAWVRETAGDRFPQLELNIVVSDVIVTEDRTGAAARLAARDGLTPDEILTAPNVLIGTTEQMIEDLQRRREEFGLSYIAVTDVNLENLIPVVQRLAGT